MNFSQAFLKQSCIVLSAAVLSTISLNTYAFMEMFGENEKQKLGDRGVMLIKSVESTADMHKLIQWTVEDFTDILFLGKITPNTNAPASTAQTGASALYFSYNPTVSPKVREEVIKMMIERGKQEGSLDSAGEQQLAESLRQISIMDTVGNALQAKGYSPHSLATATAYWIVSLLEVAQNQKITEQQYAAVLKQMEQLLATGASQSANDVQKQSVAEYLMWKGMLQSSVWQQARQAGHAKQIQNTVAVSRKLLLEKYGINADVVTVTDQGLGAK